MAKSREFMRDQSRRAIEQRSKDREFHGLEREFLYHQAQMMVDYERSKDIKHPRDLGDVRETILRKFLQSSGYLPRRYGVSERSVRVVSTTGHISKEIDIAIFDHEESITLMNRQDVYEVHPLDSVFGVIQVKSNLTKKELNSGLNNLASFKNLDRTPKTGGGFSTFVGRPKSERGFSILFAYTTDMRWMDIIAELEDFARNNPKRSLPNAVFVLDQGSWRFGDAKGGYLLNTDLDGIQELKMHGRPDYEGLCLYQFYACLMTLLRDTIVQPVAIDSYFRLPLISDEKSYIFVKGQFAEFGTCEKHGDFARKITAENLEKIVGWCQSAEPINWIRAIDIAYGQAEDEDAYRRQPGDVRIYNPDNLHLSNIILMDSNIGENKIKSLSFDDIQTSGMQIWIPYFYTAKLNLISGCPKCTQAVQRARKRQPKKSTSPGTH
jgi:hypothetical protein